ncbi:hypothetical protein [Hymenobacter koreensis]|uniref:hypothetical protein n=1 Tax=Hymenobacter koreensis TaxID=1084523 RepID=UPI0031EA084D
MLTPLRGLLAVGLVLSSDAGSAELTISGPGLNVRGTFPTARCRAPLLPGGRGVRGNLGNVYEVPYPGGTFTLLDKIKRQEGAQDLANRGGTLTATLTLTNGRTYVLARRPGAVVVTNALRLVAFDVWLRAAIDTAETQGLVRVRGHCACQ